MPTPTFSIFTFDASHTALGFVEIKKMPARKIDVSFISDLAFLVAPQTSHRIRTISTPWWSDFWMLMMPLPLSYYYVNLSRSHATQRCTESVQQLFRMHTAAPCAAHSFGWFSIFLRRREWKREQWSAFFSLVLFVYLVRVSHYYRHTW